MQVKHKDLPILPPVLWMMNCTLSWLNKVHTATKHSMLFLYTLLDQALSGAVNQQLRSSINHLKWGIISQISYLLIF